MARLKDVRYGVLVAFLKTLEQAGFTAADLHTITIRDDIAKEMAKCLPKHSFGSNIMLSRDPWTTLDDRLRVQLKPDTGAIMVLMVQHRVDNIWYDEGERILTSKWQSAGWCWEASCENGKVYFREVLR